MALVDWQELYQKVVELLERHLTGVLAELVAQLLRGQCLVLLERYDDDIQDNDTTPPRLRQCGFLEISYFFDGRLLRRIPKVPLPDPEPNWWGNPIQLRGEGCDRLCQLASTPPHIRADKFEVMEYSPTATPNWIVSKSIPSSYPRWDFSLGPDAVATYTEFLAATSAEEHADDRRDAEVMYCSFQDELTLLCPGRSQSDPDWDFFVDNRGWNQDHKSWRLRRYQRRIGVWETFRLRFLPRVVSSLAQQGFTPADLCGKSGGRRILIKDKASNTDSYFLLWPPHDWQNAKSCWWITKMQIRGDVAEVYECQSILTLRGIYVIDVMQINGKLCFLAGKRSEPIEFQESETKESPNTRKLRLESFKVELVRGDVFEIATCKGGSELRRRNVQFRCVEAIDVEPISTPWCFEIWALLLLGMFVCFLIYFFQAFQIPNVSVTRSWARIVKTMRWITTDSDNIREEIAQTWEQESKQTHQIQI